MLSLILFNLYLEAISGKVLDEEKRRGIKVNEMPINYPVNR